jgi:hypothetical protein
MEISSIRRDCFRVTATAIILLSVLASTTGCAILHPSGADGFNHQPSTFRQREALVTPAAPVVLQSLAEALNPPPPVTTTVANGVTYPILAPPTPNDVELIINWVDEYCGYAGRVDSIG